MKHVPASELLKTPGAMLTRTHVHELGFEQRAVDAIFRELDVVFVPGYSRAHVRVEDYLTLIARCTYGREGRRSMARIRLSFISGVNERVQPLLPEISQVVVRETCTSGCVYSERGSAA